MIDNKIIGDTKFQDYVIEKHGMGLLTLSKVSIEVLYFLIAMFLQHNKIPMPDITPTNFGMSVYKKILNEKIKIYYGAK